ncbi:MAG: DNA repair protein RecO [Rickettsiales bacterium]|nr:DNA repair protein RecO [Rickettsiales bacterium]
MQWTDQGILLSTRKYGENSAIARIFTQEHGVHAGVIKSIHSKAKRGLLQTGNGVSVNWQARLSEQLGIFSCELMHPNAALLMDRPQALSALTSSCALLEISLPERHPYKMLYQQFEQLLQAMSHDEHWLVDYIHFELQLLAETGFGLDLSECAATGVSENLVYISPKSGRAVSQAAGQPYHDKMLPLPAFLREKTPKNQVNRAEILAGLMVTGYFLRAWLMEAQGKSLPTARARFVYSLEEAHGKQTAKTTI